MSVPSAAPWRHRFPCCAMWLFVSMFTAAFVPAWSNSVPMALLMRRGRAVLQAQTEDPPLAGGCQETGRIVFSMTTTAHRIDYIRPALEALLRGQSLQADAVYLSIGPDVKIPQWMEEMLKDPAINKRLIILRQDRDPGPGLKLLGAAREEQKAGRSSTLIVYGDDDQVYGEDLLKLHASKKHCEGGIHKAWGGRKIAAGDPSIPILEATGAISIHAGVVPQAAFLIGDTPDVCKFSDDFYLGQVFRDAGIEVNVLDECKMDWNSGRMAPACLQKSLGAVGSIDALSSMALDRQGKAADRKSGDWRDQLRRYELCQQSMARTN